MICALLQEPVADILLSLLGGLACACVLMMATHRKAPPWSGLLSGLLPLVVVYAVSRSHRICSIHAYYHAGVIYQILNGTIPPGDILFGGTHLSYPWAAHLLLAACVKVLSIPPSSAFVLQNLICLVLTLLAFYGIARLFSDNGRERIFLAALPVFGMTFVPMALCETWLNPLGVPVFLRGTIPIADRFSNANTMPVGVALFSAYLLALLRLLSSERPTFKTWILVALLVFGSALLYPFGLAAIIGASAGACGAALALHGRARWRHVAGLSITGVIACTAALPFLSGLMAGKTHGAGFSLTTDPLRLLQKSVALAVILAVPLLVLFWKRRVLGKMYRSHPKATASVWAGGIFLLLMNLGISAPDGTEYKWRAFGLMLIGIPVAACVAEIVRKNGRLGFLLTGLLLALLGRTTIQKAYTTSETVQFVYSHGTTLKHHDPAKERLFDWIRQETEPDAIFVDRTLEIPYLGQRQLFLGLDQPDHTGWTYPARMWVLAVHGHRPSDVEKRAQVSAEILAPGPEPVSDMSVRALHETDHPVYIVVRDPRTMPKFEGDPRFAARFAAEGFAVFRLK